MLFDSAFGQIYHPREMRQRRGILRIEFFLLVVIGAAVAACDRAPAQATPASSPGRRRPTVVSLVPAATDLIIGMGAADHLVAVSNWDAARAEIAGLPRVGDYRTIDWEKIYELGPDIMIVQFREDKMPPGLRQRADTSRIRLINVKINRLDEVFTTLSAIGDAVGESSKATDAQRSLRDQLDAVQKRVAGKTPLRTYIARTQSGLDAVGGGNFMDDLLTLAGGENVLQGGDNSYPTIDREMLVSLNPDVVLQLLPGATPQEIEQAKIFWLTVPQVSAVKNGRVYVLTDSYLLLPGYSVGRIAETFSHKLHPDHKDRP